VKCEEARRRLSLAMDDDLSADERREVDDHAGTCATCGPYARHLADLRAALRFEVVDGGPDLAARVLAAVAHDVVATVPSRRRRLMPLVAAAVAGALVGAVLVSGTRPGSPPRSVAAALPEQVLQAQARLHSLAASVRVVERGWHPDVPVRTYTGSIGYRAPESFTLTLTDRTDYPSKQWRRNDAAVLINGAVAWTSGLAGCPLEGLPTCTPAQPRVRALVGREPFAADGPAPLDLVLPARSFAIGRTARVLAGSHRAAGRDAIVAVTTVAQVESLVAVLRQAGNFREVRATDPAELWLDRRSLVPLRLVINAGTDPDRRRWAAERGYQDRAGRPILELDLGAVRINADGGPRAFPGAPAVAVQRDGGFRDGTLASADGPVPSWLPSGMKPYRDGRLDAGPTAVAVRTWTDGRAWVKVRTARGWPGGRLFGDVGDVVRATRVGAAVAYVSEDGSAVAMHADGVDLVVTGTVSLDERLHVAASTGIAGRAVPAGWAEATSATLAEATAALSGLLVPATSSAYAAPAIQVAAGPAVTMSVAGPGQRGYRLVQTNGNALGPPVDADATAVVVRGATGRWSPALGVLEWVQDNARVIELRSETLALAELLTVAADLEAARP
jgi:hypothetical protein